MQVLASSVFILIIFFQLGCTTTAQKIESIEVGMHKSQVLDKLGSPNLNQRINGKNYWSYSLYEGDQKQTKVFTIFKGKVSAVRYADDSNKLDENIENAEDIKTYEKAILEKRKSRNDDFKDLPEDKE